MDRVAINTKLAAMRARFLTRDDYYMLASEKSVAGVAKKLNEYAGYEDIISAQMQSDDSLSRHSVERSLSRALFADYKKIRLFATDFVFKDFMEAYFLDNEIKVIKAILGIVQDERADDVPAEVSDYLPPVYTRLTKSKNIGEFIDNLEGTPFFAAVRSLPRDNISVFQLEMQLDLYYYMNLWKQIKKLDGKEMTAVKDIIGTGIDLRNIMWIYRFKRYYLFEPAGIYPFLIPIHYKLRAGDLRELVSAGGITTQDNLDERLPAGYRRVFKEDTSLEYGYYTKMAAEFKKAAKRSDSPIITVCAYIFFLELEINNLTTIIEGARYRLAPSETVSHLYIW